MKYSSMAVAAALALTGLAYAAEDPAPADAHYVDNMVECISDFFASEQDDSSKEKFIAECMQAKAAKAQPQTNRKG